jgi:hypothetical protein
MTTTARWRECRTCPACNHQGWCRASDDGRVACRRLSSGAVKTIRYKDGTEAYLHFTRGRPIGFGPMPPPRPEANAQRAADADLHRCYHMLLADGELFLRSHHRQQMLERGLSDADITRAAYRSLPAKCRAGILRRLRGHLPDDLLLAVPGIIRREGKHGSAYLTLAGRAGMLIPVRSAAGLILGLVVRPDDPGDGGKYRWISSRYHDGPSSGCRTHTPAGVGPTAPIVTLTEGSLKADISHALSGSAVIGMAGPHISTETIDTLRALGARKVLLALDSDARTNPHIATAQLTGLDRLKRAGFEEYGLLKWDASLGKGLDDALLASRRKETA